MVNNTMGYLIPGGLLLFFSVVLAVFFYGSKKVPSDTKTLAAIFVQSEKELDYDSLKNLYGFKAIIHVQRSYADGSPDEDFQIYATDLLKVNEGIRDIALRRNDYNQYSDIKYEWLNDKNVKVTSQRFSKSKPVKAPHVLVLAQNKKKRWVIVEEYISEYIIP